MFRYLVLLAFVPAIFCSELDHLAIEECKAGGPMPKWVTIEGCDFLGCTVSNTTGIQIAAEFESKNEAKELKVALNAFVLGLPVNIVLPAESADGCKIVDCPVSAETTVTFNTHAQPAIPELGFGRTLPVELSIQNENAERVFCVRTTVNIVA